jgi:hypothetical protein
LSVTRVHRQQFPTQGITKIDIKYLDEGASDIDFEVVTEVFGANRVIRKEVIDNLDVPLIRFEKLIAVIRIRWEIEFDSRMFFANI